MTYRHDEQGPRCGTRTVRVPCTRHAGHSGACSDTPRDIGWPGHAVLDALVEEVVALRAAASSLQEVRADLQEIVTDQERRAVSQEAELRKWRQPDADGARLAAVRAQYERSDSRDTASKVVYITALEHALGHAPAWRAIADEMPPRNGTILLGNQHGVLGRFSGVTVHPEQGVTWFIDDSLYDGDDDPTHWIAIPAVPA